MDNLKASGVYKITNISNGDFYVGSSVNVNKRWRQHCWAAKNPAPYSCHLHRAMKMHGLDNFAIEILECIDQEHLVSREQFYIDLLKPQYNSSSFASQAGGLWDKHRKLAYSARRKAEVAAGINIPPKGNAGNTEFRHTEVSKQLIRQKLVGAHQRIMAERGRYHTPEGLASKRAKMAEWLTPERRERFRDETKEALKLAKRRQKANADTFAQQHLPMIQKLLADGLNLLQIAEKMNAAGHQSRRGELWTDQTIRQILKRLGCKTSVARFGRAARVRQQQADDFARSLYALIQPMQHAGLNQSEIAARLNTEGHRTRRGAAWTYQNVRNVLRRMESMSHKKSRGISRELLGVTQVPATRVIGWDHV